MVKEEKRLQDFFDAGEEQISSLLGSLKRVEAPANFDLGVRGRIAAGQPEEKGTFRIPALVGYAIPLALLLLVGGYFGFNALYSVKDANVPAVADANPTNIAPQLPSPSENVVVTPPTETPGGQLVAKKPDTTTNTIETPVKKAPIGRDKRPGGGSYDDTLRIDHRISPRYLTTSDVLLRIGVQGKFDASGLTVESTEPNGIATKAGVKTGDVIEAVNDQPLTEKTTFKGKFTGKSLRVRRDGKSLDIILKN